MRKLFVAMVVVGLCSVALAKPKLAVLGIEVQVTSGKADRDDVRIATYLTDGLRMRAKTGQGSFTLAPNSEKELLEEKLASGCENEASSCMAQIAAGLHADYLMFGRIEKKAIGGIDGYQISLKLLNAGTKTHQSNWTDFIPIKETTAPLLQAWAKKGYGKLTNEGSDGILVLHANVERGSILIDEVERTSLVEGKAEIRGLPEGKYKVTIESEGYKRWTQPVAIRSGETATLEATLDKSSDKPKLPPESAPRSSRGCCDAASTPSAGTLVLWLAMFGIWDRRRR